MTQLWQKWQQRQRQRIFIMPSAYGYAYVVLLLIMLLGAINYNNSLGYLLCFLLVGLGQVTMHHSHRNIKGLTVNVHGLDPVFSGQPAQFRLTTTNHKPYPSYQLEVRHKSSAKKSRWPFIKRYQSLQLLDIVDGNNNQSSTLSIPTQKRGWQSLNTLSIVSFYPLGLFQCWTLYETTAQVLVYPSPKGQKPLPITDQTGQESHHKEQHGEDDFAGLRPYREGEALHRVAWKAMARDDQMRSKQFSSPQGRELLFRWEDVTDLKDTEQKLSQLCQWICQAEQQGDRYGLILPQTKVSPSHGPSHQQHCLKQLALFDEKS
ncbi:DUF58 domain-containing protein [Methylophaga thalassica]|uniref:DUF58 domain-containing protein n=1 Tax=Methylophaga aminisulfidivorans TaxID=230105 RepID=UPI003A91033E